MKIINKVVKKAIFYILLFNEYLKNIWLNSICNSPIFPLKLRRFLYSFYGHKITNVFSNCFFGEGPGKLTMGQNSYCNHGCFFDLGNDISIGRNCSIAMRVSMINGTHYISDGYKRAGEGYTLPIVIKDGCWICANVTILPGVTIGEGCIIAAGSVVNHNCEPNYLYAGVPAKKIKILT